MKAKAKYVRIAPRKARLVAKASFTRNSVDPFDRYQVRHQPSNEWDKRNGRAFSEKQRGVLKKLGVDPDKISFACGKQLIGAYFSKPSDSQIYALTKRGYNCAGMSREDAFKAFEESNANGGRKP